MTRKNIFISMAMAVLTAITMASCTLETSDNGDLDGFWHLTSVDTLSTGGVLDMSEELVFWSVQVHLLNTVDRKGGAGSYFFKFEHNENTLRLYNPCLDDRMNGDPEVDSPEPLQPFGVNAIDETFSVETLTGSTMILSTERLKLTFKKM